MGLEEGEEESGGSGRGPREVEWTVEEEDVEGGRRTSLRFSMPRDPAAVGSAMKGGSSSSARG